MKIGLRNREVPEIESKITEKFIKGKRKWVREGLKNQRLEKSGFHCTTNTTVKMNAVELTVRDRVYRAMGHEDSI